MLRVKIFSSAMYGGDISQFEGEINHWLESIHPPIRQMTQSNATDHVILTFLYDAAHRDTATYAASVEVPEAFERSLDDAELDPVDDEPTMLPEAELPY